jgi:hypothetical protein
VPYKDRVATLFKQLFGNITEKSDGTNDEDYVAKFTVGFKMLKRARELALGAPGKSDPAVARAMREEVVQRRLHRFCSRRRPLRSPPRYHDPDWLPARPAGEPRLPTVDDCAMVRLCLG